MQNEKLTWRKNKWLHGVAYAAAMALLLFLLKVLQWKFMLREYPVELYTGAIALVFTLLGIWVERQYASPTLRETKQEPNVPQNTPRQQLVQAEALASFQLSEREQEVLQLLAQGYSNAEIADKLFLSVSTVKTHVSNLYVKLDVKNRTSAMEKAIRLSHAGTSLLPK